MKPGKLIEKCARRGAKLLDKKVPGWESRIGKKLNMNNEHSCVLGWVFRKDAKKAASDTPYMHGLGELFDPWSDEEFEFGFNLPTEVEDSPKNWSLLAEAWIAEIGKRGAIRP